MSRIIKCDRCGSEIEPNAKIGYVCISEKDSSGNKLAVTNPFEELDFCTGCINAISEFVKNAGKTRKNRGGGSEIKGNTDYRRKAKTEEKG